jgi:PKD repeat protein
MLSTDIPDTYTWNFGDKTVQVTTDPNPIHIYRNTGIYYPILTVNTGNCSTTDTLLYPITIYSKPTASFITLPENVTIFNPVVTFEDKSSGATSIKWTLWNNEERNDRSFMYTFANSI